MAIKHHNATRARVSKGIPHKFIQDEMKEGMAEERAETPAMEAAESPMEERAEKAAGIEVAPRKRK
jgi:hypothetical protein